MVLTVFGNSKIVTVDQKNNLPTHSTKRKKDFYIDRDDKRNQYYFTLTSIGTGTLSVPLSALAVSLAAAALILDAESK